MGSDEEFGPDTETIRAWLAKRASYAGDARVIGSPHGAAFDVPPVASTAAVRRRSATPRGTVDERDIGRSILDALDADVIAGDSPPAPQGPVAAPSSGPRWQASDRPAAVGLDTDFPVRSGVRRSVSLILLACVAATCAAAHLAGREQTSASVGVAAILGFLTLVVWAVRASCTTTRLSLRRGQLRIERGGATEVVDIGNPYTPLAIIGDPGARRWRVLVERPGQPLLVITPGMVDPGRFTEVLYRLRPELGTSGEVGTQ